MTKSLRKAIMLRSRLKNNFNKKWPDENLDDYKKQRNNKYLINKNNKYFPKS